MEEVRSYWQVTSIHHFCNTFGRQFKLPSFEPEQLEQAFILDIPAPVKPNSATINPSSHNNNINQNGNSSSRNRTPDILTTNVAANGDEEGDEDRDSGGSGKEQTSELEKPSRQESPDLGDEPTVIGGGGDTDKRTTRRNYDNDDEDYKPPNHLNHTHIPEPPAAQQQNDEQENYHLLVKLAIALMKPHFNCKLTPANWENYLKRLVDTYWVELEHCPSPFTVPLISQDGVELTKNLTFNELPLSDKIDLLYALCDYRLWCEDVPEALKDYSLEELRLESIGKDSKGYEYWYFSGARLYRENKELSQDIIMRKKRIKELEYKLVELEKTKIFREKEEKRKADLERAKQQAAEAREARLAAKKKQEQEAKEHNKRRKQTTPTLPPRTGLRERRSSATSNNNESQMRTTRSRLSQQQQPPLQQQEQTPQPTSTQKTTRSKTSRQSSQFEDKIPSPDLPKKTPEEECAEELEQLLITKEDRAEAWSLHCESLESWEEFAAKFEKTKSINEKYLVAHINENLLPHIRSIYAKKAAEVKRKEKELLLSLTSRRVSTRIISKRAQEEEEERRAQLHDAEMKRKKAEAEQRLRAELEREMRARREAEKNQQQQLLNGGTSPTCSENGEAPASITSDDHGGRYNLRQQQQHQDQHQQLNYHHEEHSDMDDSDEFGGIIHPNKLAEFYEALELVVDTVRTSKHAWPFVDPVPETVPGYYDLIKEPMDLRKLRTKIEFREYKSLIELEKDFQLLVNNCEKFNGPKNVYTKMVYKLWKSFRKNVRLYLQRDLNMDENETFIFPPVVAQPPASAPVPVSALAHAQPHQDNHHHHIDSPQHPNNNHANAVSESKEASIPQTNHVPHQEDVKPTAPYREPVTPGPPQMSPVTSLPPITEVSPVHKIARSTSPPPRKAARPELEDSDNPNHPTSQNNSTVPPPNPQVKAEPLTTISEEIIIDSYTVDCPDDNFFIWSQDIKSDEKIDN